MTAESGFIGILSLDTRFPRILGDAGHPGSYHMPARIRAVVGAGSPDIVRDGRPAQDLTDRFVAAAQELEAEGAVLITSTCGFLVTVQDEIAAQLGIPVLLSGLSLFPVARVMTGGRPVGVLTASRVSLGRQVLSAAAVPCDQVRIAGLDGAPLFSSIFLAQKSEQHTSFDPAEVEAIVVDAAMGLIEQAPGIGAILFECGNLPPYAAAVRRATGRAVLTLLDGARMIAPSGQAQVAQLG